MASTRDQALIDEVLRGRTDAFGELIQPYQDRLYNTLYRMVGSADDAAELFQEALIRAYRGLATYHGDASFYTWFYRVALNVVFTDRRRQRISVVSTESTKGTVRFDLPDGSETSRPGHGMEVADKQRLVQQALSEVAEMYRAVLVLKDIDGLKYEEIALILDIPVGTVRSRLHRARCELKEKLQPLWDSGAV